MTHSAPKYCAIQGPKTSGQRRSYATRKRQQGGYFTRADFMPTTEVAAQELKCAVESKLGGTATFVESVPISASRGGVAVWKGAVHIFDLVNGLCGVSRAYAWSDSLPDGQRRSVAVLHIPPIVGPREAVKVTMLADEISN